MNESEKSFLIEALSLLSNWRRFLIINISAFTFVALVISLILPKWYRAEAKILTSSSEIADLGLSSLVGDLPFQGLGLIPKNDETLRYLAMLESRTIMMNIANRFNLQERYDTPNWEKTLRKLTENVSFDTNVDETLSIHVWDQSPEFAAEMANTFVQMLDSLNIQFRISKARDNREFLETRLEETKKTLANAEQNLKTFQEKFGIIDVTEQARSSIQTISGFEAQVIVKETELRFKRNYLSEDHAEIDMLQTELRELKKSLRKIQHGTNGDSFDLGNILIPSRKVPALAMNYFRLLRDVEVQNLLYKLMTQQYEQARIFEAKKTPIIQVLDWAVPPIYKDRPKRAYIVLGALFFSSFISIFFAAGVERWRRIKAELQVQTNSNGN